jgi:hypothetical protein
MGLIKNIIKESGPLPVLIPSMGGYDVLLSLVVGYQYVAVKRQPLL